MDDQICSDHDLLLSTFFYLCLYDRTICTRSDKVRHVSFMWICNCRIFCLFFHILWKMLPKTDMPIKLAALTMIYACVVQAQKPLPVARCLSSVLASQNSNNQVVFVCVLYVIWFRYLIMTVSPSPPIDSIWLSGDKVGILSELLRALLCMTVVYNGIDTNRF